MSKDNFSRMLKTTYKTTRRKVLKVAKGWAKVEKMNDESTLVDSWWLLLMSTLEEYSWRILLKSTLEEYSWWVLLMSILDEYSWWVLLMTTLDDSWCFIWNYHYGRTDERTNRRTNERTTLSLESLSRLKRNTIHIWIWQMYEIDRHF